MDRNPLSTRLGKAIQSLRNNHIRCEKQNDFGKDSMEALQREVVELLETVLLLKNFPLRQENEQEDPDKGAPQPGETKARIEKGERQAKRSDTATSLNEKLARQARNDSLAEKLRKKPIRNLSSAIGVNDRFVFIKELFGGSADEYDRAIERFNTTDNGENAKEYLRLLSLKYQWTEEEGAFASFSEFIERKFD